MKTSPWPFMLLTNGDYLSLFISALTKVYEKANSVVSYEVNCPTWLHKYIIGRKGAGIQKLTGELQKVIAKDLQQAFRIKNLPYITTNG